MYKLNVGHASILALCCLLCIAYISNAAENQAAGEIKQGELEIYISQLEDADPAIRLQAAKALASMGPRAEPAVEMLCQTLGDNDSSVGKAAAEALARMGESAIPELVRTLREREFDARRNAQTALVSMGPEAEKAVPLLVDAMKTGRDRVPQSCAEILLELAVSPEKTTTLLQSGLEWPEPARIWVHCVLGSLEQEPEQHVSVLVKILETSVYPRFRWQAIDALGLMGPKAKNAIPPLSKLLGNDLDELIRAQCAQSLGKIGTHCASPGILYGRI